jgi:hypothetical protein
MKAKLVRILPLVLIIGAMAAIPASTQVLQGATADDGVNLPMVILVNRLELTTDQMQVLKDTIDGLLAERSQMDQALADFEQEMIAFSGTADELDARLQEFQGERRQAVAAFQDNVAGAIDEIKATLSMKQGEILTEAFPGLATRAGDLNAASGIRDRIMEQIGSQLPGMMERLRDRFGGNASADSTSSDSAASALRERVLALGAAAADEDATPGAGAPMARMGGRAATGRAGAAVGARGGFGATRVTPMLGWLEQLSHVLDLKLQNAQP